MGCNCVMCYENLDIYWELNKTLYKFNIFFGLVLFYVNSS